MKIIRVWWPTSPAPGNLGDVLTPLLLKHFGFDWIWTDQGNATLLCVGSIIRFARRGQTVLGSGAMWKTDVPNPGAKYLAVRGPLTRELVLEAGGHCPPVFGDPALLLPDVFGGTVRKKYDVGIIPHYVDYDWIRDTQPGERVIDILRADPLEVVREIRECRSILSSSLHGIVVAHAYGIPAGWVRFSDKLSGDGTKFADYAASLGINLRPAADIGSAEFIFAELPDLDPLREAFRCL